MEKLGFESFEKNPEIELKMDWSKLSDLASATSCSATTASNSLVQCQDIIDAYWGRGGGGGGGGISINDKISVMEARINDLEKLVEKFSAKTVLRFSLKTLTGEWKND